MAKTMYMHTINGKPARGAWYGGHILVPTGRRQPAPLFASLKEIRRMQVESRATWRKSGERDEWAVRMATETPYGYVLVEVPSDA